MNYRIKKKILLLPFLFRSSTEIKIDNIVIAEFEGLYGIVNTKTNENIIDFMYETITELPIGIFILENPGNQGLYHLFCDYNGYNFYLKKIASFKYECIYPENLEISVFVSETGERYYNHITGFLSAEYDSMKVLSGTYIEGHTEGRTELISSFNDEFQIGLNQDR